MTTTSAATPGTRRLGARDVRGYWRTVLAVCAPVGWLAVGVSNLLTPYPLGGDTAANVAGVADHQERTAQLIAVYPLFVFTFVPGVIALIMASRRRKPLFTAVLGTLGVLGALAGTANPAADLVILSGVEHGLSPDQLVGLVDGLERPSVAWTLVFTLLFITIGRIAAGILMWRASVGPRPFAVLMAISPFVEFVGLGLGWGNGAPGTAWVLSGIAMIGVTIALVRMPNDEFDLPPTSTG
jgi:hypothetical protein